MEEKMPITGILDHVNEYDYPYNETWMIICIWVGGVVASTTVSDLRVKTFTDLNTSCLSL